MRSVLPRGVADALVAATVFGSSTPFAKRLGAGVNAQLFAGLLYLGSGLVLTTTLAVRRADGRESHLQRIDARPLAAAVVFGGMAAPILLLIGLRTTPAASASLLLNFEAVLTAVGAWLIAKEHADRRIVGGMLVIVAGGVLLSLEPGKGVAITAGALAIVAACGCWAVDNVATRPLALRDPRQVAAVKGVVAGGANVTIGVLTGGHIPSARVVLGTVVVGFIGYGLSLVLYVRAVRHLGTARTGAYYAAAPFIGAGVALVWLREPVGRYFWPAVVLMVIGLAIHLTESHGHEHVHDPVVHEHGHDHDDEHHSHAGDDDGVDHALAHRHQPLAHDHGHTPDSHHRHDH